MDMRKTALVTGSSKGIGRAIALELAQNGYDVGVNYCVSEDKAKELCQAIDMAGGRSVCLKADVSKVKEIDRMFEQFFDTFGHIDLLVNNAGITRMMPFLEVTEEMWQEIVDIDWKGSFFCAQRAAQNMVDHKIQGSIINITSVHQTGCWPTANVYGPVKAALMKFTMNGALELAKYGIRMNAIAPGYTEVGKSQGSPESVKRFKRVNERIPLGRYASSEEIAHAAVFLASDKANYMTGTCLNMDGGILLPVYAEYD
jgi:NAD(P)-dependent dehydrogenase (short-subunit alcohol dehydrogenase family)